MKATLSEKEAMLSLINSLQKSMETSWSYGEHNEWVCWARKMRDTINTATPCLKQLIDNAEIIE